VPSRHDLRLYVVSRTYARQGKPAHRGGTKDQGARYSRVWIETKTERIGGLWAGIRLYSAHTLPPPLELELDSNSFTLNADADPFIPGPPELTRQTAAADTKYQDANSDDEDKSHDDDVHNTEVYPSGDTSSTGFDSNSTDVAQTATSVTSEQPACPESLHWPTVHGPGAPDPPGEPPSPPPEPNAPKQPLGTTMRVNIHLKHAGKQGFVRSFVTMLVNRISHMEHRPVEGDTSNYAELTTSLKPRKFGWSGRLRRGAVATRKEATYDGIYNSEISVLIYTELEDHLMSKMATVLATNEKKMTKSLMTTVRFYTKNYDGLEALRKMKGGYDIILQTQYYVAQTLFISQNALAGAIPTATGGAIN